MDKRAERVVDEEELRIQEGVEVLWGNGAKTMEGFDGEEADLEVGHRLVEYWGDG